MNPLLKREDRPGQAKFAAQVHTTRGTLHAATDRLTGGHITADGWYDEMHAALLEGHTHAWMLGRQRAGDFSPLSHDDHTAGRDHMDAETEFLQGFRHRIKDGVYTNEDGSWKEGLIKTHVDLYAQKLRGTANEAFVETSEPEDDFYWDLGGAELHCEDCPAIAAGSPYTQSTLYTYPCNGDTECLGNCDCSLRRVRGSETLHSFGPVDLAA